MDRNAVAALARLAGLSTALADSADDVFAAAEAAERLHRSLPKPTEPDAAPWAPIGVPQESPR